MNRKQAIFAILKGAIPFALVRSAQAEGPAEASQLQHRPEQPSNSSELERKVADLMRRISALEQQSKANIVGFTRSGTDLVLEHRGNVVIKPDILTIVAAADATISCANLNIDAKGNGEIKAGMDAKIRCANFDVKADMGASLKANTDMKIKGMNVEVKADMNANINGGQNAEIKGGMMAKLDGTMTDVSGSATTKIKGGIVMIN